MGRVFPSPPRAVTACPAAIFLAAFTSAFWVKLQATQQKRAWLLRLSDATNPHAEHRWLVYAGRIFSILPGALSSKRRTNSPHPERWMPPLSPAFARTRRPGLSLVPLAERIIAVMFRSSTLITSNLRARLVLVFSTQSLRLSVSRALSFATAAFTFLRRFDAQRARPSLRCNRANRAASVNLSPGTRSSSPVDMAAGTATPRSIPTTRPLPGAGIASGMEAKATCHLPARSRVTRYDFTSAGTARDQRNRTQPAFGILTSPTLREIRRTSHCLPRLPTTRNPSSRPAFRHDGSRCVPLKKFVMACAKSRNACCWTVWLPLRSHGCSARAAVSCRHCSR